jgi:hypothetical protein
MEIAACLSCEEVFEPHDANVMMELVGSRAAECLNPDGPQLVPTSTRTQHSAAVIGFLPPHYNFPLPFPLTFPLVFIITIYRLMTSTRHLQTAVLSFLFKMLVGLYGCLKGIITDDHT